MKQYLNLVETVTYWKKREQSSHNIIVRKIPKMKGIKTPEQALGPEGFAPFSAPRGEVWNLSLPALARQRIHGMAPLLSLRWAMQVSFRCRHSLGNGSMGWLRCPRFVWKCDHFVVPLPSLHLAMQAALSFPSLARQSSGKVD